MVGCNSKLKADNRECAVFEAAKVKARQEKKKGSSLFQIILPLCRCVAFMIFSPLLGEAEFNLKGKQTAT